VVAALKKPLNKLQPALVLDEPKVNLRPDSRAPGRGAARPSRPRVEGAAAGGTGAASKEGSRKGKREFDRRSGTGRGAFFDADQKREGAGKYNWGDKSGATDDAEDALKPRDIPRRGGRGSFRGRGRPQGQEEQSSEAKGPEETQKAEENGKPQEEAVVPEEPEEKTKSYAEYLQEKQAKALVEDIKREIRRPENEGEWKATVVLAKVAAPKTEEEQKEEEKQVKKKKVQKVSLFEFVGPEGMKQGQRGAGRAAPSARGGGATRGARGTARGGAGAGRGAAFVESNDSFPVLKR